jgi:hypothetical protein
MALLHDLYKSLEVEMRYNSHNYDCGELLNSVVATFFVKITLFSDFVTKIPEPRNAIFGKVRIVFKPAKELVN